MPDARRVTILYAGEAAQAARLASYAPAVGDTAVCIAQGSAFIALGKVA